MEASTVARKAPPEPEPSHDGAAEATKSTEELFQWSTNVHVGIGALDCEHGLDGACDTKEHFHAWLCLPNTFQARDIQDKAAAAKARKRRALQQNGKDGREPTDSALVLEEQIEAWTLTPETYEALISQVADRRVKAEYAEIAQELQDSDQFENYGTDVEEFRRVAALPEEERDPEDWKRLEADVEEYRVEFEKRATARFESEQYRLRQLERSEVLEVERRNIVDTTSGETFLHVYYTWAYYTCARVPTLDGYPDQRAFTKPEDLKNAPPEVIVALRTAYRRLESKLLVRGDATGN